MTGKEFFSMRQWPFIIQNQCDILKTNVTFSTNYLPTDCSEDDGDKFSSDVDGKLCSDDDTRSTICVESDSVTFVTGCLSDSGPGNV